MASLDGHRLLDSRWVYFTIMGFALIPGFMGGWGILLLIQPQYFPVITEFEISHAAIDEMGDITLDGKFTREYSDLICKYDHVRWYMADDGDQPYSHKHRVMSGFPVTTTDIEKTRYSGHNHFESWKIQISKFPNLQVFSGYVQHICLGFFPARTNFPTYQLPNRTLAIHFSDPDVELIKLHK